VGGKEFRGVEGDPRDRRRRFGTAGGIRVQAVHARHRDGAGVLAQLALARSVLDHDPRPRPPPGPPKRGGEESGDFALPQATTYSVNTGFAQVASAVTPEAIRQTATRMGIRSPLEPVCSITLGTQAVHPL